MAEYTSDQRNSARKLEFHSAFLLSISLPDIQIGTISARSVFFRPLVELHHLTEIDPQSWYPSQRLMSLLRDIEQPFGGGMMAFVNIGMRTIEEAVFPPEFEQLPFPQIMAGWNKAYHLNHRGPGTGDLTVEQVDATHRQVTSTAPWPDDLTYGTLYGAARRFLPEGTRFIVRYDEDEPRNDEGGTRTIIHIEWY